MITAGSENKELAYKFLEYMIQAQTQKKVTDVTGLHARQSAGRAIHDRRAEKSLHLDNVDDYQKRIYFWQNVPAAPSTTKSGTK